MSRFINYLYAPVEQGVYDIEEATDDTKEVMNNIITQCMTYAVLDPLSLEFLGEIGWQ